MTWTRRVDDEPRKARRIKHNHELPDDKRVAVIVDGKPATIVAVYQRTLVVEDATGRRSRVRRDLLSMSPRPLRPSPQTTP